ncbi:MAG TPA: hypothetical protein VF601_20815 [Beijerinckiaceae bacterium]|jgi:hypothetical protein
MMRQDLTPPTTVPPKPARVAYAVAVLGIAAVQGFFIAAFACFALAGDSWGIARALALGLSLPFVLLTVPALAALRKGRARLALALAVLSFTAFWLLWRFA